MKAVFGIPPACPSCGGHLQPAFGMVIENNVRRPVMSDTTVICRDCGKFHPIAVAETVVDGWAPSDQWPGTPKG